MEDLATRCLNFRDRRAVRFDRYCIDDLGLMSLVGSAEQKRICLSGFYLNNGQNPWGEKGRLYILWKV